MKNIHTLAISLSCFIIGLCAFAYSNGWILLCYPSRATQERNTAQQFCVQRKTMKLFFWKHNHWNNETVQLLQTEDTTQNIQCLLNNLLTLLDEENIMDKRVTVQSALVSNNKHMYISFDRNPFNNDDSTYKKILLIEQIIKTIRENNIPFQDVYFLVHHQPINDYHLDFSNPWPRFSMLDL